MLQPDYDGQAHICSGKDGRTLMFELLTLQTISADPPSGRTCQSNTTFRSMHANQMSELVLFLLYPEKRMHLRTPNTKIIQTEHPKPNFNSDVFFAECDIAQIAK